MQTGAKKVNRRMFLGGLAAVQVIPAATVHDREVHRFRAASFDIEMTVEYRDGYSSSGFWFRQDNSGKRYCLSASGEEDRHCLESFRGSLAIARYRVQPRSGRDAVPSLREHVRTVDKDARLRDRPPFECTIQLTEGIGSDLQAFGYERPGTEEEAMLGSHGPWYLFRQDLSLEPQHTPFLTIFWKHSFPCIRMLDVIPTGGTSVVDK
jgi:hypothetical protein